MAPRPRRVSLPWVTLGLLVIAGCMLAGATLANSLQQSQAVLAAAQPIQVGQAISEADLTTVELAAAQGVAVIPAADQARVVGQPAAVVMLPGMLLTPGALGQPAGMGPNEALAGVELAQGRFPPGVGAGAQVELLDTGAANAAQPSTGVDDEQTAGQARVLGRATVVAVQAGDEVAGGGSVATLKLLRDTAQQVTATAAAGRLALVLVTEGA